MTKQPALTPSKSEVPNPDDDRGHQRFVVRIPKAFYEELKEAAAANQRSLNSEILLRLGAPAEEAAVNVRLKLRRSPEDEPFISSDRFKELEGTVAALKKGMDAILRKLEDK